jgi:hypothetical protein
MNGNIKCVENQGKNYECVHVKYKFVITIMWNNYTRIKFHLYHLATILWGIFFCFFYSNENVFYNFYCYIVNESVESSNVVFFNSKFKGVC